MNFQDSCNFDVISLEVKIIMSLAAFHFDEFISASLKKLSNVLF